MRPRRGTFATHVASVAAALAALVSSAATGADPVIECPGPLVIPGTGCPAATPDLAASVTVLVPATRQIEIPLDGGRLHPLVLGRTLQPVDDSGRPAPLVLSAHVLAPPPGPLDVRAPRRDGLITITALGAGVTTRLDGEAAGIDGDETLRLAFRRPVRASTVRLGLAGFLPGAGPGDGDDPVVDITLASGQVITLDETRLLAAYAVTGPGRGEIDFAGLALDAGDHVRVIHIRETAQELYLDHVAFTIEVETTVTQDPPAGTALDPGTTTITLIARAAEIAATVQCEVDVILTDGDPPVLTVPANASIGCEESTAPGHTGQATADDLCDATPAVTFSDQVVAGACPQTTLVVRTWIAADAAGNSVSGTQLIQIDDTTAPVVTPPPDVAIDCAGSIDPAMTGQPTTLDACDPAPRVQYTDQVSAGACPHETLILRTWTATDACGNSADELQVITLRDETPPVITVDAEVAVSCSGPADPGATGPATATDSCDTSPIVTYSDDPSGMAGCDGFIVRTWTAIDACGNMASVAQTITMVDDVAPTLIVPADSTVPCDDLLDVAATGQAVAADTCDIAPTVSFTDDLSGLDGCGGTILRTWTAADACGNTAEGVQSIAVVDTTAPVIASCPPDRVETTTAGTCATSVALTEPAAVDDCDDAPLLTGIRSDGLALDDPYPLGSTTITWTAVDACGNLSPGCMQTLTVSDAEAPVIQCPAGPVTLVGCDGAAQLTYLPAVDDGCDQAPVVTADPPVGTMLATGVTQVRYTAVDVAGNIADACEVAVEVVTPPRLSLEVIDGPTCVPPGPSTTITVAVRLSNLGELGVPVASYQTFVEFDTNRLAFAGGKYTDAPFGLPIVSIAATAGGRISLAAGIDLFAGQAPTLADSTVAILEFTPLAATCASTTVEFATSGQETILTGIQADVLPGTCLVGSPPILIDGEAPRIDACCGEVVLDANASCQAFLPLLADCVDAADSCAGDDALTVTQVPPVGTVLPLGSTTVTLTVTDCAGNSTFCQTTVTVRDVTAPVIDACPASRTLKADNDCRTRVPDLVSELVATDACDNPELLTIVQAPAPDADAFPGNTVVLLTVTDDAGNSTTCTATLTVIDAAAPIIVNCPADVQLPANEDCQGVVPELRQSLFAIDNCTLLPDLVITQAPAAGTVIPQGTTTVTFTVFDEAGLLDTCQATVAVGDQTVPIISTCPADVVLPVSASCQAVVPDLTTELTAVDDCDTHLDVVQTPAPGTQRLGIGSVVVTLDVIDDAGNAASCQVTVSTVDEIPPQITACAGDVSLIANDQCSAVLPQLTGSVVATDNCFGSLSYTQTPAAGTSVGLGATSVTLTVTDASGNTADCTTTVLVEDTGDPIIICPANLDAACTGPEGATVAFTVVATDACDPAPTVECFLVDGEGGDGPPVDPDGTVYPLGRSLVTCRVTDAGGNASSCLLAVTVSDTSAPEILACPADAVLAAGAGCRATVPDLRPDLVAEDPCGDTLTVSQSPPAGTLIIGLGESFVTLTVSDASGNSAQCKTRLTVQDSTPPLIAHCPNPLGLLAGSSCHAQVPDLRVGLTATDDCTSAGNLVVVQAPAPGTSVPEGSTSITFTVTDLQGNTAQCSTTLLVTDGTEPVILVCPGDRVLTADAGCSAPAPDLTPPVAAFDDCTSPGSLVIEQVPAAGAALPPGSSVVTISVTDLAGNVSLCSVNVTVSDDADPVLTCPDDIETPAGEDVCHALVDPGQPTATDNCDDDLDVNGQRSDGLPLGDPYPLGTTIISWTVTDDAANHAACTQIVEVVDDRPPLMTCPADISVAADPGLCSSSVGAGVATARDGCDSHLQLRPQRSDGLLLDDPYPAGTTTVTWTATDDAGLTSTCVQTIQVSSTNRLLVDVAFADNVDGDPITRCLTIELWSCEGGGPVVIEHDVTFVNGEARGVVIDVPCGEYACATVRDRLHTLRRTAPVTIAADRYELDLTGPRALASGDLNGDGQVNVVDWAVFASRFLQLYDGADTPCDSGFDPETNPHADVSGNGFVFVEEHTIISARFREADDAPCCGGGAVAAGAAEPLTSIAVAELVERGLGHLEVADLDGNGFVDELDMQAFGRGDRPRPQRVVRGKMLIDGEVEARDIRVEPGARLVVTSGTLYADHLEVAAGAVVELADPHATIVVGAMTLARGAVLEWTAGTIVIDGGVLVTEGTLSPGADGHATLRLIDSALVQTPRLEIGPDGVLDGDGTIDGDLVTGGVVRPDGIIVIGRFTQLAEGLLDLRFPDLTRGDREQQAPEPPLVVLDEAWLDGGLTIGFAPPPARAAHHAAVVLLPALAVHGRFADIDVPPASPGLRWEVRYDAEVVTLGTSLVRRDRLRSRR